MSCFSARTSNPTVAEPDPTKHVNFNLGMVLGVDDFTQEFAYLSGRDQWIARDLIGYGTARGLSVKIEKDTVKGPRVEVESGVAVSPRGQMICVPSARCAYLRDAIESRGAEVEEHLGSPLRNTVQLYIMLCYRDCPTDKVPIAGEPCRSEDELMAPSRLTDSFHLELSFKKPNQREEEAVRDFVTWLRQVEINETVSSTALERFLDEIRAAAQPWFGSPPASPPSSPPGDFMSGSPSSVINSADLCEYMRAAFRVWVTELRPKWIARWHGCAPAHFDLDDRGEEDCVLLADLTVPIIAASPGTWTVADSPDVLVNERRRPFVVHLRMLQEWLLCGSCCTTHAGGSPPLLSAPGTLPLVRPPDSLIRPIRAGEERNTVSSDSLTDYRVVAAGIVSATGSRSPALNNLRVVSAGDGLFRLSFDGYRPPDGTFQYLVKALPVSPEITTQLSITFVDFLNDSFGLRLTNAGRIAAGALARIELMVEVSEVTGLGDV